MKKLYSLVLMATALLIGTQTWAVNVSNEADLRTAITNAVPGTPLTITLSDDIEMAANGATIMLSNGEEITLDLNGKNLKGWADPCFEIWHGKLSFIGSGTFSSRVDCVVLRASDDPTASDYCYCYVGPNVNVVAGDYGIWIGTRKVGVAGLAYGAKIIIDGHVSAAGDCGLYINGSIQATTGNVPEIYINETATIQVPGTIRMITANPSAAVGKEARAVADAGFATYGNAPSGIYAGGFAVWNIKGTVIGGNGVYVKGGRLNVDGGNIQAIAEEYWKPLFYSNGAIGAGSAIILDNNKNYSPELSLHVTGNAVVTSESGCAIEELVTKGSEKMGAEDFVIESGTFTSGTDQNNTQHAAVTVTTELGTEVKNEGTVSGGMFSTPVDEVLSVTGETTEIVVDGQTYQVIHEAVDPLDVKTLADATISDPVKMDATNYIVASDATAKAKYLELANGATVTVEGTLVIGVEGVVIKDASKITVKAGGKLVINAGIITTSADQLVVEASETQSGVLVAAPGVKWNAQPLATVQFYTFAKQYATNNNAWQRIATPLSHYIPNSMSSDFSGTTQDGNAFTTWVQKWNGTGWEFMTSWSDLEPFHGYALSNNSINGGVTYSFKGNIQGGVSSELTFISEGLNFFGNSYIAPIKVVPMLQQMVAAGADDAFHIWNAASQRYDAGSSYFAQYGVCPDEIPATQTFVMNLRGKSSATADIDYANSVWAPYANMAPANPAPAVKRSMPADLTFVQINITGANGDVDKVMLAEGEQFSNEFDNGADIVKYMEANRLNMYVEGAENYAAAATNDLLGTTLAINAANEINYTMTFSNVMGEGYAIKDMMTGVVTDMVEGNEYRFVAQSNATTEGRFQIVERNNMPTAIENTEVKANVKGIYSITGMYLGEDFEALPAGVYVVDGVKIVK